MAPQAHPLPIAHIPAVQDNRQLSPIRTHLQQEVLYVLSLVALELDHLQQPLINHAQPLEFEKSFCARMTGTRTDIHHVFFALEYAQHDRTS